MKSRPILFSAPMVRALLAGTKTQTRRMMKPQPDHLQYYTWKGKVLHDSEYRHFCWKSHVGSDHMNNSTDQLGEFCPYGVPGDRLWVRETWCARGLTALGPISRTRFASKDAFVYAADHDVAGYYAFTWRPSIHMPRWASRITLEITDVRVQRVQEISEEDALAEGVGGDGDIPGMAYEAYMALWERINGVGSWKLNPRVWALTFKRVKP